MEIFTDIVLRFGARIGNAKPIGDDAIIIATKIDQDREALAADLELFVAPRGWIVTSRIQSIIIEPYRTASAPVKLFLFHVTRQRNVQAIMLEGLKPQTGGGTAFQRHYPPRLHLARTLSSAFRFIDFQTGRLPGTSSLPNFYPVRLNDLTVLRIRHASQRQYFFDPVFPGEGVYVENIIPPADITTVPLWQAKKRLYDFGVQHGWW